MCCFPIRHSGTKLRETKEIAITRPGKGKGDIPLCHPRSIAIVLPAEGDMVASMEGKHFRVVASSERVAGFKLDISQVLGEEGGSIREVDAIVYNT